MTEKLTFIEINPGLGSSGFAAEAAGLLRLGPVLLSKDVRGAYVAFHGTESDSLLDETSDLVVADLPFTMFLDGKNADPAVTDVIGAARSHIRRGGIALFRVKWDIGHRLAVPHEEYLAVVRSFFPKYAVSFLIDTTGASDGIVTRDLYVVASPSEISLEDVSFEGSVTAIHPLKLDDTALDKSDPQLIFDALGFPEDFHRVAGSVVHVHDRLRECVAIRRASAVLQSVASHLRG